MGTISITAFYAGLLAIVLIALSVRVVIVARARAHVPYGDGGRDELTPVVRGQANFTEYVPLALLLIGYLEFTGSSSTLIHGLGAVLLAARVAHPFGLLVNRGPSVLRAIGTVATWLVLLVAAAAAIWQYVSGA
ncbi:MAG: MAPEG family protein [Pseudomonadota bacterium]